MTSKRCRKNRSTFGTRFLTKFITFLPFLQFLTLLTICTWHKKWHILTHLRKTPTAGLAQRCHILYIFDHICTHFVFFTKNRLWDPCHKKYTAQKHATRVTENGHFAPHTQNTTIFTTKKYTRRAFSQKMSHKLHRCRFSCFAHFGCHKFDRFCNFTIFAIWPFWHFCTCAISGCDENVFFRCKHKLQHEGRALQLMYTHVSQKCEMWSPKSVAMCKNDISGFWHLHKFDISRCRQNVFLGRTHKR